MNRLVVLVLLFYLSTALAGCGGSGAATGPGAESPQAEAENEDLMQKALQDYKAKGRRR